MTFAPGVAAELDEMFRQRHAGGAGQPDDEDEKVAAMRMARPDAPPRGRTISRARSRSPLQPRPCTTILAEQMPVRHDGGLDGLLVGIEHPDVLPGPAVQHELVAHGGAGLAEADDAHAVGKERVGFFREGSVGV